MFGTIAELRIGLLRLVGTESADPELVLRGEALNAALDDALNVGLINAQRFLVDVGAGDDWLATATLTFGAADATGVRTATAPTDLLRFAGDDDWPALYNSDTGQPWGQLLRDKRRRRAVQGDWFWMAGGSIVLSPLAAVPTNVKLDYYQKLSLPAGNAVVSMDEPARPLIIAEAGYHAMGEYWIPTPEGTAVLESRLQRNRLAKRTEAAMVLRKTDARQTIHEPRAIGSHWFLR